MKRGLRFFEALPFYAALFTKYFLSKKNGPNGMTEARHAKKPFHKDQRSTTITWIKKIK